MELSLMILGGARAVGAPLLGIIARVVWGMVGNKQQEQRMAQDNALRSRGVTAPAVVVSARKGAARSPFGAKEIRIDYEVDVQPEGRAPFRQSFQHWAEGRGFTAVAGQLAGGGGQKDLRQVRPAPAGVRGVGFRAE